MKNPYVYVLAMALLLLSPFEVKAESNLIDTYKDYSEIPAPLQKKLRNATYYEKYLFDVLVTIRQYASDNKSLTSEDIEKLESQSEERQRTAQIKRLIAYDTNYDGEVSLKDEADPKIRENANQNSRPEQLKRLYDNIAKYDVDKDGILTYKEMATIEEQEQPAHISSYHATPAQFLELDPNKDNKLTIRELETLARKAFYTIDKDQDGIISQEERKVVLTPRANRPLYPRDTVSASCKFPEVPKNLKIAFIGVYEGKTVSNISIAGQVEETNVIPVQIDPSDEDLYLIMSSFRPVIWKFEGETSRIKKLVLAGPSIPKGTNNNDLGADHINAGATGVSKDIISYHHARECGLRSAYDAKPSQQDVTLSSLKKLLDKSPEYYFAKYGVIGLNVRDGRINEDISQKITEEQKRVPEGFNASMWKKHLRHMPGGLIKLDEKEVLSDADVEPYKVLPKWAGISKLVFEGAIIPVSNGGSSVIINRPGQSPLTLTNIEHIVMDDNTRSNIEFENTTDLRIVKEIPYYPAGLHGGYSTNFIIAKGVKPPEGDPGHSKVRHEK